jgi:hypothetical protein
MTENTAPEPAGNQPGPDWQASSVQMAQRPSPTRSRQTGQQEL